MTGKNKKSSECRHSFVKYPPRIGKLKVCTKCGFLWAPGGVKSGNDTVKISGSGNYIETQTISAPASPVSGKVRIYAASNTSVSMVNSSGTVTDLAAGGGDLYNFLTNPGFEIWQRGAGPFTANAAYAADRWKINLAGTSTLSVSRDSANAATDSQYCAAITYAHNVESTLTQSFADEDSSTVRMLRGRTITFAVRVKDEHSQRGAAGYQRCGHSPCLRVVPQRRRDLRNAHRHSNHCYDRDSAHDVHRFRCDSNGLRGQRHPRHRLLGPDLLPAAPRRGVGALPAVLLDRRGILECLGTAVLLRLRRRRRGTRAAHISSGPHGGDPHNDKDGDVDGEQLRTT